MDERSSSDTCIGFMSKFVSECLLEVSTRESLDSTAVACVVARRLFPVDLLFCSHNLFSQVNPGRESRLHSVQLCCPILVQLYLESNCVVQF